MDLKDVAAVSGKSGLHRVVKPTRTGVILEILDDSRKRWIANASHRVSVLKEISIYVTGEESSVLLEEVFEIIHEKYGKDLPVTSKDSTEELASFLEEILPDYDRERVYPSDIKKLVTWYTLVSKYMPESFEAKSEDADSTQDEEPDSSEN